MSPGVVTIVLAAGRGARLGGPKALLLVHDAGRELPPIPLLEAQCRDRRAAESERVLAVVRPDMAELLGVRLRAAGATVVVSRAPEDQGPAGSLAAAANHLRNKPFRVAIVTPVDVRVAPATVARLIEALMEVPPEALPETPPEAPAEAPLVAPASSRLARRFLAAVPRFSERRGHPVALAPEALARYCQPSPPPLRDHLRSLGDRVVAVDVDDPFVLEDLDFAHQTEVLLRIAGAAEATFLR